MRSHKTKQDSYTNEGPVFTNNKKNILKFAFKLFLIPAAIGILFILYYFGIGCLFRQIFSIPCPGCGMTRAFFTLLQGDMKGALLCHFMLPTVPMLYLYILFDGELFDNKIVNRLVLIAIVTGFFVKWMLSFFCNLLNQRIGENHMFDMFTILSLITCAISAFLVGLAAGAFPRVPNAKKTNGIIVSIRRVNTPGNSLTRYKATYEYEVSGRKYLIEDKRRSYSYKVGQKRKIIYDELMPENAVVGPPKDTYAFMILWIIIGIAMSGITLFK